MSVTSLEVLGTVRPDGTLELDQKLTVPPGRVKVRLEPVAQPAQPTESLVEFVQRTRRELEVAGHRFRTKEEIDAELEELRNEWEERLDDLGSQRDPPTAKEKPGC